MKSKVFYMLISISGSGKSTYAKKHFPSKIIVCPDDIRKELSGDISNQDKNGDVWTIALERIKRSLEDNGDAVLDATNVNSKLRQDFLSNIGNDVEKIAIVFPSNVEWSRANIRMDLKNKKDRSRVPDKVLQSQYIQLQSGMKDLEHQFDKTIMVKPSVSENKLRIGENKMKLKDILTRLVREELQLKKHGDTLVVVSDKEDRKDRAIETYKNKDKLKALGFRWNAELSSWTIGKEKFRDAQEALNSINNKVSEILDVAESLPEFINTIDDPSKKNELSIKIDTFINDLQKGVDEKLTAGKIKDFLDFCAKFHEYSYTNSILIYIQKPNSTKVAGYKAWKEKFHRQVNKGATSISIFAPIFANKKNTDDMTGSEIDTKNIDDSTKDKKYLSHFVAVRVFDISDTTPLDARGEVPENPQWHDSDEPNEKADELYNRVVKVAEILHVPINIKKPDHGEQGSASPDGHINISCDIAGVNRCATTIHEMAHNLMHFDKQSIFYYKEDDKFAENNFSREQRRELFELQAEAVSYVVLKHYGFDVHHQTTYIALWRANKQTFELSTNLIKKVSKFLINKIDEA